MNTLTFLGLTIVAAFKFAIMLILWGIFIAIGFEIGKRIIVKFDVHQATKKVVEEMKQEGTF